MLTRSILRITSRSSVSKLPWRTTSKVPSYLSSRRSFSTSKNNIPQKPNSGSETLESRSHLPKLIAGSLALGSVLGAAYHFGFLDKYLGKEEKNINEYDEVHIDDKSSQMLPGLHLQDQASDLSKPIPLNSSEESDVSISSAAGGTQDTETQSREESIIEKEEDKVSQAKDAALLSPENSYQLEGEDLPDPSRSSLTSDDVTSKLAEQIFPLKKPEVKPDEEQKVIEVKPTFTSDDITPTENEFKAAKIEQIKPEGMQEVVNQDSTQTASLLDEYYLKDESGEFATSPSSKDEEDVHGSSITKDGKLVLDFLQALHAAEKRQAEMDAQSFAEEKRVIKEKYEKELKDARVRELMYAEREAILEKELNKERVRAAAALKALQENLEGKLKTELEQKEAEVEQTLKEMQVKAKAELAAAIAREKASQIERMAEANLHINALCMAFYARSEEARQSHSVHKLAVSTLALEDAVSKGLPIQKEIETLHTHLADIDKDPLITLVLSSLPEDSQIYGTDTIPQLNQKFGALKGTLRHFSIIPPEGGGILTHSVAWVASWLKVKEVDQSGDGIESLMNRVENLLAQGKLCEAADTLENGVQGTQGAEVVVEWVRRARNRAITEQALSFLKSYVSCISLT